MQSKKEQVANRCSHFDNMYEGIGLTNSVDTGTSKRSCANCMHFKNHHCDIDAYDQIEENINEY